MYWTVSIIDQNENITGTACVGSFHYNARGVGLADRNNYQENDCDGDPAYDSQFLGTKGNYDLINVISSGYFKNLQHCQLTIDVISAVSPQNIRIWIII